MAAGPRVHTISRWKQWQYALRAWLPAFLLLLLFISLFAFVDFIAPNREVADVQGAATRRGTGVVTSFFYESAGQSGQRPPDQVNIALNGTEATYKGTKFLLLRKGQHVEVTYRVGKSGNIYVGDITPEGEAKP